jgi:hypothetical protein
MRNSFTSNKNTLLSSFKAKFSQKNNLKTKEDLVAKIHKYNINTITMVNKFKILTTHILGLPRFIWQIFREKI